MLCHSVCVCFLIQVLLPLNTLVCISKNNDVTMLNLCNNDKVRNLTLLPCYNQQSSALLSSVILIMSFAAFFFLQCRIVYYIYFHVSLVSFNLGQFLNLFPFHDFDIVQIIAASHLPQGLSICIHICFLNSRLRFILYF